MQKLFFVSNFLQVSNGAHSLGAGEVFDKEYAELTLFISVCITQKRDYKIWYFSSKMVDAENLLGCRTI